MIVDTERRELILHLRDPTRILETVPDAREHVHQGHRLIAVPHTTPTTHILSNLGIDPPHPVDHYYRWPIRPGRTPLEVQRATVRFLTRYSRAYCLNDMGTAKTLAALWSFDWLRQEGQARRLLVVAPLSTVERTWGDEIFHDLPHLQFVVLHGHSRKERLRRLDQDADVYIINHDGVKVIQEYLTTRVDLDTVVIDELSQAARNATTALWRALNAILRGRPRVWGMTGTPTPNSPMDAWAQCRLITPSTVPSFYSHWRNRVMIPIGGGPFKKWHPKEDALSHVERAMQPAIRYRRDECIDLPPVTYETRSVALTADQQRLYEDMMKTMVAEYRDHKITAVNAAVKGMRMVQIASGVAYGPDRQPVVIAPKPRMAAVIETIEEAAAKVIVFVPWHGCLHLVADALRGHFGEGAVAVIHGGVPPEERNTIFSAFQSASALPRIIVAQPKAMSHGLTLTAANVVIWYAPITSAETYEQANARITRPGQRNNQLIVHIEGTKLERKLYETLKTRTDMQSALLDLFAANRG